MGKSRIGICDERAQGVTETVREVLLKRSGFARRVFLAKNSVFVIGFLRKTFI
jgi:hypothetical protein